MSVISLNVSFGLTIYSYALVSEEQHSTIPEKVIIKKTNIKVNFCNFDPYFDEQKNFEGIMSRRYHFLAYTNH